MAPPQRESTLSALHRYITHFCFLPITHSLGHACDSCHPHAVHILTIALLQVLKRPHWLLVTLLLVNAAAMEALPIFLDRLVSPTAAIVLSVTAVLFFGEQSDAFSHASLQTFSASLVTTSVAALAGPHTMRLPYPAAGDVLPPTGIGSLESMLQPGLA